jgi:hypothetical protein
MILYLDRGIFHEIKITFLSFDLMIALAANKLIMRSKLKKALYIYFLDFGPGQLTSFMFILSYEAEFL